ncbi:PREDICTED: cytosolic phospholipase A2-like [Acropora digitifera]|uniref:cytosolic phospholipase A2-like n=1 Tax=Acropora digitifera TaxID=70779 RepID=UPI00077A4B98|nr:PREDICTED: cytosolic phospholipase A2-like [Acropora digitifera]
MIFKNEAQTRAAQGQGEELVRCLQASPRSCIALKINVLRARNVTLGWHDWCENANQQKPLLSISSSFYELLSFRSDHESDLRYSTDLCDEEKQFRDKRREVVYEVMKQVLGERAPRNMNEVPTVAVLGSGGGYRATAGFSAACCALEEMGLMDCVTYLTGLSGSAWGLSLLYSQTPGSTISPNETRSNIREQLQWGPFWLLTPRRVMHYVKDIIEKWKQGQPVSLTDFYGHCVGESLLGPKKDSVKLSHQKKKVECGCVPMPIYTAINSRRDISADAFAEWVEFTPYEIGMDKYGTFMKTELFGSKFFCGKLVEKFPESPLYYLQGIWGSFYAILLQRVIKDGGKMKEIKDNGDEKKLLVNFMLIYTWESDNQRTYAAPCQPSQSVLLFTSGIWGSFYAILLQRVIKDGGKMKEIKDNGDEKKLLEEQFLSDKKDSKTEDGEMDEELGKFGGKSKQKVTNSLLEKLKTAVATDEEKLKIDGKATKSQKAEKKEFRKKLLDYVMEKLPGLQTRSQRAALIHNFLRGLGLNTLQVTDGSHSQPYLESDNVRRKQMELIDAGLMFNSPYPPLLRKERSIDLILSFDFSARETDEERPFKNIKLAEEWAKRNGLLFPPIDADEQYERDGMKECYVFKHPTDPACPIVLHFVLINKTYRDYRRPGEIIYCSVNECN